MKRSICTALILVLLLSACGGAPAGTTPPAETTQATQPPETDPSAETAAPGVENDMSYRDQDLPIAVSPAETTLPGETAAPAEPGYTLRLENPETMLYAGPAFVHGVTALLGEAGAYTIVEEAADADGNTWGRLKSGAGWVCLTDPPLAPIYADYAPEDFNAFHAYWSDETDYITAIGFTSGEKLTDVRFGLLDWFETESWQMSQVLYTMEELDPDHAFLAQVVFWGDMTTYGISFTDESGEERHYAVSISGKDGSLVCTEYLP